MSDKHYYGSEKQGMGYWSFHTYKSLLSIAPIHLVDAPSIVSG